MSLLSAPQTTPITDKDVLAAQAVQSIRQSLQSAQSFLIGRHNDVMRVLWSNPKLTPQEICNKLGTDAASLFVLGGKLSAFLADINAPAAGALTPPKKAFTLNTDGTVVISDADYVAS